MKSNLKIVLTALLSVLLVGAGVGAQPSSGTPDIGTPQTTSDSSHKSMIDTGQLGWLETRLNAQEKRLTEERQFIQETLGLTLKIGAAFLGVIVSVAAFFGYKNISSIEDRVNKAVHETIKEKSNDFNQIFEQQVKLAHDKALIWSYAIQFSAPSKHAFGTEMPIILPTHIELFVEILSDKNADEKLATQILGLFSDVSHDDNSSYVNKILPEMVSCAGRFLWIKSDPTRLSKIIDLLRDRNLKAHAALVRAFLKDETTAPDVKKSAVLYAERVRDTDAVDCLADILSDKSRLRDADETIFALVSLNPKHPWVLEWITDLRQQARDHNLAQAARVAGYLMQSLERRNSWSPILRDIENDELEHGVNFAATVASLIIDNGGLFFNEWGSNNERIRIGELFFDIKGNLFLGNGKVVVSMLCRDLIDKEGIVGITKFLKKTKADERYDLKANLGGQSSISVDVHGAPCTIRHRNTRFSVRPSQGQDDLWASWRTDEGAIKAGVVKRIDAPNDAWFSFNIPDRQYH